jgi:hypothetical protein
LDDFPKEEILKKAKSDTNNEASNSIPLQDPNESGNDSNIKEENFGDEDNEGEEESQKDDADSVDSIELQKMAYKFGKPTVWELQPISLANVYDFGPDLVVHKWVKGIISPPSSHFPI